MRSGRMGPMPDDTKRGDNFGHSCSHVARERILPELGEERLHLRTSVLVSRFGRGRDTSLQDSFRFLRLCFTSEELSVHKVSGHILRVEFKELAKLIRCSAGVT